MNKKKLEKKAQLITEIQTQNEEFVKLIEIYKEKVANATDYTKELQDLEHKIFRLWQRFASEVACILFNK